LSDGGQISDLVKEECFKCLRVVKAVARSERETLYGGLAGGVELDVY